MMPSSTCAIGSEATMGASKTETANTKTALTCLGMACDEKNGAEIIMLLRRTMASIRAER